MGDAGDDRSLSIQSITDWTSGAAESSRPDLQGILSAGGYEWLRQLGRGQYGTAHLVRGKGGNAVAKLVLLDNMNDRDRTLSLQEVEVLRRLRHPNIVRHHASWRSRSGSVEFDSDDILVNIMEFCAGGDLRMWLQSKAGAEEHLVEHTILRLFGQMICGIQYIHQHKILHRDLKSSNMLLDRDHQLVKIGDFGIARVLENTSEVAVTMLGTPYYMSPEVCRGEPYGEKSDMWSMGCVLYEMCVLRRAFEAQSLLGLVYCIVSERYDPIPGDRYSQGVADLIALLLSKSADDRPSAEQVMSIAVLQEYCAACNGLDVPPALGPAPKHRGASVGVIGAAPPPPPSELTSPKLRASRSTDRLLPRFACPKAVPGRHQTSPSQRSQSPNSSLPPPPPLRRPSPPTPPPDTPAHRLASVMASGRQPGSLVGMVGRPSSVRLASPAPAPLGNGPRVSSSLMANPWRSRPEGALWTGMDYDMQVLLSRICNNLVRRSHKRGNWVQAFARNDSGGKGILTGPECIAFLQSLSLGLSRLESCKVTDFLLRDGDGVSLGHFNEAITHKPPCDVNAGEDWAKQAMRKLADNVVGGIPSMLRQSFKQVLADSKSQLSTQEASRLQAWLPKTQDGDIDWAATAEWCAPPPPPPPPQILPIHQHASMVLVGQCGKVSNPTSSV